MDTQFLLIAAAVVAAIAIYIVAREKINLHKAATGEDKERLHKAVAQALPGETGYQVVYGHYEKVDHFGHKTLTTYLCYALAFDASRIWIIPLLFDKDLILPGEPIMITRDNLGCADIRVLKDKMGEARRLDFTLYNKDGLNILNCVVEAANTREDRFHHVNIVQTEECARFNQIIGSMAYQANRDNAGLLAQVHTSESNMHKAYALGILSLIFSFIFPPIGVIMCIIGIRYAKNSRTEGQINISLLQCRIGLVISIIFTLFVAGALIYAFLF